MTEPFRIRPALLEDLGTIVEFNAFLASETESKTLNPEILRNGVLAVLSNPGHGRYYIAEATGTKQVIGQAMITFEWSDWRNGVFWWLQSVYVDRNHRGQGIFRGLYEAIAQEAGTTPGVCGIRLYVEEHNLTAIETYKRLGLSPTPYRVYEKEFSC